MSLSKNGGGRAGEQESASAAIISFGLCDLTKHRIWFGRCLGVVVLRCDDGDVDRAPKLAE